MRKLITRVFRNLLPAGVAGAGITVAQLHGSGFWIGLFGSEPLGWAVSLTWEASSVWLWWRGDRTLAHRLAKWTATLALVMGMAVQSAGPLLTAADQAQASGTVLSILHQQSAAGHWISQTTLKRALATATVIVGTLRLPAWAVPWIAASTAVLMPALYALALLAITTMGREWRSSRSLRTCPNVRRPPLRRLPNIRHPVSNHPKRPRCAPSRSSEAFATSPRWPAPSASPPALCPSS